MKGICSDGRTQSGSTNCTSKNCYIMKLVTSDRKIFIKVLYNYISCQIDDFMEIHIRLRMINKQKKN